MMPGENGFAFAASLRQRSDVPIVMLTARSEAADRVRGLEIGVDDYLAKPFEPRELLLRIGSVLRAHARAGGQERRRGRPLRPVRLLAGARRTAQRRGDRPPDRARTRDFAPALRQRRRQRVARGAVGLGRGGAGAHGRRADQPPAPQDRGRSGQSGLPADGARLRLSPASPTDDRGGDDRALRRAFAVPPRSGARGARSVADLLPKGLYARSLLIVIVPMVLLQTAVAYVFMQRHWDLVTHRLSAAVARDVGAMVDLYRRHAARRPTTRAARDRRRAFPHGRRIDAARPAAAENAARPSSTSLDPLTRALPEELGAQVRAAVLGRHRRPLRADGDPRRPRRPACCASSRAARLAYEPNVHIFILWMLGASIGAGRRSRSCSCATRSGRSCGSPTRRRISARGATSISIRAARARCARPATPSSR